MALPLPQGKLFQITYRMLPADFGMPSMEVASDHYSLIFILSGDRRIITPTYSYTLRKGSIYGIAPYLYHRTVPDSHAPYESILLKFNPKLVEPLTEKLGSQFLDNIYASFPMSFPEDIRDRIFSLARDILTEYDRHELSGSVEEEDPTYIMKIQSMLTYLLLLMDEYRLPDESATTTHSAPLSRSILEAVYFIEKNYMKPIKIEDASAVSGYSPSYFSRLFSNQLGTAFSEYLCITRLKHVQNMLLTTDKSVMDIALECGFSYPGNMTAAFKKEFGMTPLQFRKK